MPIEIPSLSSIESMFKPRRPISEADRLAQEFSSEIPNKSLLVGKLFEFGIISGLDDWTQIKKLDPSATKADIKSYSLNFYYWNPHILKYDERWVIQAVGNQPVFGIDSLKIGLDSAIPFEDRCSRHKYTYMLPYIHFGTPRIYNPDGEEFLKKHSIASVDFILFTKDQINDLRSVVDSVLEGKKSSVQKSAK